MWTLDPKNSRDLFEVLRRHARQPDGFDTIRVGLGWRPLVAECHRQLVEVFPDYELLAVKQKDGLLAYQAFPWPEAENRPKWSVEDLAALDEITDAFAYRSESICEWCGAGGELRTWRAWELTLCDGCDQRFPDPPYKLHGKLPKGS